MGRFITFFIIAALTFAAPVSMFASGTQTELNAAPKSGKKKSTKKSKTKTTSTAKTGSAQQSKAVVATTVKVPPRPEYTLPEQDKPWETGLIVTTKDVFLIRNNSCSYHKYKSPDKHVRNYKYEFDGPDITLSSDVDILHLNRLNDYKSINKIIKVKDNKEDIDRKYNMDGVGIYDYFPFEPETAYCAWELYFVHQGDKWIEVHPHLYRGKWAEYITKNEDKKYYYISNGSETLKIPKKLKDGASHVERVLPNGSTKTYVQLHGILDNKKSRKPLDVDPANLLTAAMSEKALIYQLLSSKSTPEEMQNMSKGHLIFTGSNSSIHNLFLTRNGANWKYANRSETTKPEDYVYLGKYGTFSVFSDASGNNIQLIQNPQNPDGLRPYGFELFGGKIKNSELKFWGEFNSFTSKGSHIMALSKYNTSQALQYIVKDGYTIELYDKDRLIGKYDILDPNAEFDKELIADSDNGSIKFSYNSATIKNFSSTDNFSRTDFKKEIDTKRPLVASARMKQFVAKKEKEERDRKLAEKKRKEKEARDRQIAEKQRKEKERKEAGQRRKQQQQQKKQSQSKTIVSNKTTSTRSNNSTRQTTASNNQPKTTRIDLGNGGYMDMTTYPDGTTSSHTVNVCFFCRGTAICKVCGGRGGTYNGYTQLFYPCGSCFQSGKCSYCSGTGTQHTYSTTKNGVTIGKANDNLPAVITGPGTSSSSSSSSGSRNRGSYKATCTVCNGTGVGSKVPSTSFSPSRHLASTHNEVGHSCTICGQRSEHWHLKCGGCNGLGYTRER